MKKMRVCLFAVLPLLCLCGQYAMAQGGKEDVYDASKERFGYNTLTVQLYPIIFNGYGLEYGRSIYKETHWIKVNGCVHIKNDGNVKNSDIRRMMGTTVGAAYQYNFFELTDVGFRTYLQAGVDYSYMNIENGARALRHIERMGASIALGFRQNIAKPLFFDFYIGYGHKWLLSNTYDDTNVKEGITKQELRRPDYNKNSFDYGYTGSMLVVGLNIGFLF